MRLKLGILLKTGQQINTWRSAPRLCAANLVTRITVSPRHKKSVQSQEFGTGGKNNFRLQILHLNKICNYRTRFS
jgi:hypothetical protein